MLSVCPLLFKARTIIEKKTNKKLPILFHTVLHYVEVLTIAKLKIGQCILMTDSPNLMLAKVSCYMVVCIIIFGP